MGYHLSNSNFDLLQFDVIGRGSHRTFQITCTDEYTQKVFGLVEMELDKARDALTKLVRGGYSDVAFQPKNMRFGGDYVEYVLTEKGSAFYMKRHSTNRTVRRFPLELFSEALMIGQQLLAEIDAPTPEPQPIAVAPPEPIAPAPEPEPVIRSAPVEVVAPDVVALRQQVAELEAEVLTLRQQVRERDQMILFLRQR